MLLGFWACGLAGFGVLGLGLTALLGVFWSLGLEGSRIRCLGASGMLWGSEFGVSVSRLFPRQRPSRCTPFELRKGSSTLNPHP